MSEDSSKANWVKEQIASYLDLLEMKHSWNDEKREFELLFKERKDNIPASPMVTEDEDHFRYKINVVLSEKWVQVYCDVYPLEKIPEQKKSEILLDLLGANRKYAEVCFDYDQEGDIIGTSQEMMVQGLNFDAFREEFLAVPWAVKRFWSEIAKKHNLE
ncbi:MAG: hypothetical protein KGY80_09985 [Candidatus Thorarchaeota archaeon]|nr:hypothetical protein [Candidatus Thorarchaeota archaeon]